MFLTLIAIKKDTSLENSNTHPKNQAIPPTPTIGQSKRGLKKEKNPNRLETVLFSSLSGTL